MPKTNGNGEVEQSLAELAHKHTPTIDAIKRAMVSGHFKINDELAVAAQEAVDFACSVRSEVDEFNKIVEEHGGKVIEHLEASIAKTASVLAMMQAAKQGFGGALSAPKPEAREPGEVIQGATAAVAQALGQ
jgi:hypothetical protein